jgi:hypothetical protein
MTTWSLSGDYFEACNCDAVCPCIFLSPPTKRDCTALVAWHIDQGSDGDVKLDGLNVAFAIHSPGNMSGGNWKVAVYLDDRADDVQAASLTRIFGGQAGGFPAVIASTFVGEVLGIANVPIDYQKDGKTHRLSIPGIVESEIEDLEGQNGGEVLVSGQPLAISPGNPAVVAHSKQTTYTDHGMNWSLSGTNGLSAPFSYSDG